MTKLQLATKFAQESNAIEGEMTQGMHIIITQQILNPNLNFNETFLLHAHKQFSRGSSIKRQGMYRDCMVTVGSHIPPDAHMVPHLMANFFLDLHKMNAWEAHNRFQDIHPFEDFNGRTGRLLWLWKSWHQENYRMERSFLHQYYYQTLSNMRKK